MENFNLWLKEFENSIKNGDLEKINKAKYELKVMHICALEEIDRLKEFEEQINELKNDFDLL